MNARRTTVAAAVVLAALIAVLVWKTRSSGESQPATTATATAPSAPATFTAPPVAPIAPAVASVPAGSADADDTTDRPQPVPLPPGETPPPLDGKKSEPAPPQKDFTPAEVIAKREADLKLLDDTKVRLEQDLAAAKTAHDATAAHDLEIRIARLTDLRKKRSSELDQLKGSAHP